MTALNEKPPEVIPEEITWEVELQKVIHCPAHPECPEVVWSRLVVCSHFISFSYYFHYHRHHTWLICTLFARYTGRTQLPGTWWRIHPFRCW